VLIIIENYWYLNPSEYSKGLLEHWKPHKEDIKI